MRGSVSAAVVAALVLGACGTTEPTATPQTPEPRATLVTPQPPLVLEPKQPRPNMLVIEADDMRWDDLRWMPNVRRLLQRRGLTFENSFAPYPLCCPSRASFLTGRYAHNHHVYSHDEPFGFASFRDRLTIATVLQKAGYRTALVGKYLNGYGVQPRRPGGESSLLYQPPGWTQWYAGSDRNGGTYNYFNPVQNINGRIHSFPGAYSTDVTAAQTRGLVTRFGQRKAPWFVWWTPIAPHHGAPVELDDPLPTARTNGETTTWVTPARPDWVKGHFDRRITHGSGTPPVESAEEDVSDKPRYLRRQPELTLAERDALTRVTRQRAESMLALDVQIGHTISRLSASGQLRNTLVLFTSDNGYYLGEHRKRQGKINLHEPSLRVPLIIAGPGVPRGRRYDPVTTVDLAPTLASYAGTRMPRADGVDLTSVITDGDRGWDRAVVTEGMMPEGRYAELHRLGPSPLNTRGLRLGRWKLTRYSTGENELYDLKTDPLELMNLARSKRHAEVRSGMKRLFRRYQDCRADECRVPLPPGWRLTPEESRTLTVHQLRATRQYFAG